MPTFNSIVTLGALETIKKSKLVASKRKPDLPSVFPDPLTYIPIHDKDGPTEDKGSKAITTKDSSGLKTATTHKKKMGKVSTLMSTIPSVSALVSR
ncbi:hypothetical protein HDV05_002593 [Chytridiales sp. JEL 0842]|nr:hypothetical protein HDV05_002593 [Chytridiales sp. JEL 0842]